MSADTTDAPTPPPVEGGCLCGAVRYRAAPTHRKGYYCHCRMCQLAVGNPRAAFINLRKDQVTWLGDTPTYFASSSFAKRGFCGHCGTPMSFEYHDSHNMDLTVGSLDEPAAFTPTAHYAIETRVENWHADDGLPGKRLDQDEQLTQRWNSAYGPGTTPGITTTRPR